MEVHYTNWNRVKLSKLYFRANWYIDFFQIKKCVTEQNILVSQKLNTDKQTRTSEKEMYGLSK